jgi:hypothetical protein
MSEPFAGQGNKKERNWAQDPKAAYDYVFNTHFWGDRNNAGENYKSKVKKG